jgi:diphosphomevalonate decarboxylase
MASLSLCLMDIERIMFPEMTLDYFNNKASFLSRLGSGSASRSIRGPICIWGSSLSFDNSNDYYAIEFGQNIHSVFKTYRDTILIIDDKKKNVSSSKGHELMINHPLSNQRIIQSNKNIGSLISTLKSGDLESFIKIVELEALTLHALMMTSNPSYTLINPETLNVINKIIDYRETSKIPICFTLDAGPNVHILYPESFSREILDFINSELITHCKKRKFILDKVGTGAKKN